MAASEQDSAVGSDDIEYYDAVVVGTGVGESMLAAALSRVGKKVLHVDHNPYYAAEWATFNLPGLRDFVREHASAELTPDVTAIPPVPDGYTIHRFASSPSAFNNAREEERSGGGSTGSVNGNRYNLDVRPKLLLSRGKMVEALVQSRVGRYLEFRPVEAIHVREGDSLVQLPCSKADIFNTKALTPVEKRFLMKFMSLCMADHSSDVMEGYRGRPFAEFLKSQKLSAKLQRFIVHAIAMATNEDINAEEGMERVRKFAASIGRYGNTPYLATVYGTAELAQAFCRMSAVFGGIYMLGRQPIGLLVDASDQSCAGIVLEDGEVFKAKSVVVSPSYIQKQPNNATDGPNVHRAIVVTDRTLHPISSGLSHTVNESIATDEPASTNQTSQSEPGAALDSPSLQPIGEESQPPTANDSEGDAQASNGDARETALATNDVHLTILPAGSLANGVPAQQVTLLELGPRSNAIEAPYYAVHLTCTGVGHADETLLPTINALFARDAAANDKPRIQYFCTFHQSAAPNNTRVPHGAFVVGGCDGDVDCDSMVSQSRAVFEMICPGEDWLPPAPEPEDIVWDDDAIQADAPMGTEQDAADTQSQDAA